MRPSYSIHFEDMYDKDVYINIRVFYARCGFRYIGANRLDAKLIVVLRGTQSSLQLYRGLIHVYDYVKNKSLDTSSLSSPHNRVKIISMTFENTTNDTHIFGYLPVIPEFWQRLVIGINNKSLGLTHIGSYKGLKDRVQDELVGIIKKRSVKVYGFNWSQAGILAEGISHLKANVRYKQSKGTLGLMYDYQRGKTLSSRAWHGPIHGCPLISHKSEKVIGFEEIPGLMFVDNFELDYDYIFTNVDTQLLKSEATKYWNDHNILLAEKLGLSLTKTSILTEFRLILYELLYRQKLKEIKLWAYNLFYTKNKA